MPGLVPPPSGWGELDWVPDLGASRRPAYRPGRGRDRGTPTRTVLDLILSPQPCFETEAPPGFGRKHQPRRVALGVNSGAAAREKAPSTPQQLRNNTQSRGRAGIAAGRHPLRRPKSDRSERSSPAIRRSSAPSSFVRSKGAYCAPCNGFTARKRKTRNQQLSVARTFLPTLER